MVIHFARRYRFLLTFVNRELNRIILSLPSYHTPKFVICRNLDTFQFVLSLGTGAPKWMQNWDCTTCAHVALYGNLSTLQWVRDQGCEWDKRVTEMVAQRGRDNVETLNWLICQDCVWTERGVENAAMEGNLDVVKWWWRKKLEYWSPRASSYAAARGKLEILQWMATQAPLTRSPLTRAPLRGSELAAEAVKGGHLNVLRWMIEKGNADLDSYMHDVAHKDAASFNHDSVLEWLHENGYAIDWTKIRSIATTNGCEDVLDWANANERRRKRIKRE